MSSKLTASLKTLWKYVIWTVVAAICQQLLNLLPGLEIPVIWVPIIAAVLKSIATYAATQAE